MIDHISENDNDQLTAYFSTFTSEGIDLYRKTALVRAIIEVRNHGAQASYATKLLCWLEFHFGKDNDERN